LKDRKRFLTACNIIKKTLSGAVGLSLLETAIALSVMVFIVITFSLVVANNYKSLNSSGQKSSANYGYQSTMENNIAQGGPGTSDSMSITLKDSGGGQVNINLIGLRSTAGNLTSFLPASSVNGVAVNGVSLAPGSLTLLEGGDNGSLTTTISPSSASNKNVTWTSSDTQVATVTGSGLTAAVAPVSSGYAVITVTTIDGGFTATCEVTVNECVHVTGVTVSPASTSIKKKKTTTLTATVLPADATNKSVTWSSSDTGIATVDGNGVVTAKNTAGSCIIKVTTMDGGYVANCNVTVNN